MGNDSKYENAMGCGEFFKIVFFIIVGMIILSFLTMGC